MNVCFYLVEHSFSWLLLC